MPVKIPDGLPAGKILESEGILTIPEGRAFHQDIRPLRVAIVNIMPQKSVTETQLLRLLSNSPLQIEKPALLHFASHASKNTPAEHLQSFYKSFAQVRDERFDCLIITGAPVETINFIKVDYWSELCEIMDWSLANVYSTLHICWGAQAGLFHHWGVKKRPLGRKQFGVFEHRVLEPTTPLLQGFDEVFWAPHSRHTQNRHEEVLAVPELKILADSERAGVYLVSALNGRQLFVTGHPEYDPLTLKDEYKRDWTLGVETFIPENYFPDNDLSRPPLVRWRAHANLLFSNWLNDVYQNTPFDLATLERARV